jgi:hypothetical protein
MLLGKAGHYAAFAGSPVGVRLQAGFGKTARLVPAATGSGQIIHHETHETHENQWVITACVPTLSFAETTG